MKKRLVKVCCISSLTEAKMALDAGADWLGLVSEMPSGPGVISMDEIARIVSGLPPETRTVLLTSKTCPVEIIAQHNQVKTWGLQLVDELLETDLKHLRKVLPHTHLIQVIHVRGETAISKTLSYDDLVDAILLDSGNPEGSIRTLGGTGKTHNWDISQQICAKSSLPVFLAGGLTPENISSAIDSVSSAGFDLCSGIRADGKLDRNKLESFMRLVHKSRGSLK